MIRHAGLFSEQRLIYNPSLVYKLTDSRRESIYYNHSTLNKRWIVGVLQLVGHTTSTLRVVSPNPGCGKLQTVICWVYLDTGCLVYNYLSNRQKVHSACVVKHINSFLGICLFLASERTPIRKSSTKQCQKTKKHIK